MTSLRHRVNKLYDYYCTKPVTIDFVVIKEGEELPEEKEDTIIVVFEV